MFFFETCKLFGLYSENLFDFLDYIPKIRSIIWISTINKDFCGLLVAFYQRVSIIMLQKSSAQKGFRAEDTLCIRVHAAEEEVDTEIGEGDRSESDDAIDEEYAGALEKGQRTTVQGQSIN